MRVVAAGRPPVGDAICDVVSRADPLKWLSPGGVASKDPGVRSTS